MIMTGITPKVLIFTKILRFFNIVTKNRIKNTTIHV
jgi:hypothetical protein